MISNPKNDPCISPPAAKELDSVADIYISQDFDIAAKAKASDGLVSLVKSSEISEDLRQLFFEVS